MYTYGNALETQSGRFGTPGDFFTYVCFIAATILVSLELAVSLTLVPVPPPCTYPYKHLNFLPAQPCLAEAVPELEGDHPCTSHELVIRNQSKRVMRDVGMVGVAI